MSDPTKNPFVEQIDQAVVHHEAREFADSIGYRFGVLTDGTIVLTPAGEPQDPVTYLKLLMDTDPVPFIEDPPMRYLLGVDPGEGPNPYAGVDPNQCFDCGTKLTALDRCTRIVNNPNGPTARPAFWTRFVCPEHYKNPL